jgi:hypothetical protein
VPDGDYRGAVFTVGVPDELDAAPVLSSDPPLDQPAMAGPERRDFVRLDLYNALEPPDDLWELRLASVGCTDEGACKRPNRPRIRVEGFDPTREPLTLYLQAMLAGGDIEEPSTRGPSGCTSEDPDTCPPLFANLGLDFATGRCADDCAGQTAFGVR